MTGRRLLAPSVLLISALALAPRVATLTAAQGPSAAKAAAPEYGPPNGTLVIAGGSTLGLPRTIIDKFVELGGGVDGKFVIVPTAMGNFDGTGDDMTVHVYVESEVIRPWVNFGLKNVKMLHTHDPKIADTEEFAQVLSDATAVWFTGGRHWRIVDSYAGTLTYKEFHKVLERGGVIGGSSAGATIQGDYLVRGDSRTNTIVMTDEPNHQKGFEFLRRSAIDQHIDIRNRWFDLVPVIKRYPNLLGIGLSEDTAIVVQGDQFEVIGKWKVAIHDNTQRGRWWRPPFYLLGAGDIYDMKTRQVVTDAGPRRPLSNAQPTGTARPRVSAATVPPAGSSRLAAPSGAAVGPGNGRAGRSNGSSVVPAPIPISLPPLLERLLLLADDDASWSRIEAIDVDSDGEIDLLRIYLVDPINGETMVWEIGR